MTFNDLQPEDIDIIKKVYKEEEYKSEAQKKLGDMYGVSERTIRRWANRIEIGLMKKNIINPAKIMIYDIETSRVTVKLWWTGKQYVNHRQLENEPHIISIAWKWLGDDVIHHLTWDKNHNDEKLLRKFVEEYNKADMVIGQNNDRFDNRWVNARAMKYGIEINTFVRSFDIMKESKRLFRLPSYSMDYISKFLDVEKKQVHEGMIMWDKIESGNIEEQEEYLAKMVEYNKQDVVVTEEIYLRLRKYMGHKIHLGVVNGEAKYTCPNCGGSNIKLYKTTVTPSGTIQRVMKCNIDKVKYKISNKQYMNYLEFKMKNKIKL